MKTLLFLAAGPLLAHTVSMSSGELNITDTRAHYVLEMPAYELSHVKEAEKGLLDAFRIAGARRVSGRCAPAGAQYRCEADYDLGNSGTPLRVECRFAEITVPNHVHVLRARRDDRVAQVLLGASFNTAEIRFRHEILLPAWAITIGWPGVLLVIAIAAVAKNWKDFVAVAAGELAARWTPWYPAMHFVEIAVAILVTYLLVEAFFLPDARGRWAVTGLAGFAHGLNLRINPYFTPVLLGMVAIAGALWAAFRQLPRMRSKSG